MLRFDGLSSLCRSCLRTQEELHGGKDTITIEKELAEYLIFHPIHTCDSTEECA